MEHPMPAHDDLADLRRAARLTALLRRERATAARLRSKSTELIIQTTQALEALAEAQEQLIRELACTRHGARTPALTPQARGPLLST
jgi:hypothetical protein